MNMRLGLAGLTLGLTALLAGCSEPKAVRAPCPAGKVCLERGNSAEPTTLDPLKSSGTWEEFIVSDLMVGLTQSDVAGETIPGMAKSWETSPDGLVWTFHLRDAKWSDGVPVSADDVVYSLQRILDPKDASEYASILYPFKNAQPVNDG
jgi:oligopeptide transport system substrate-binding protein